MTVTPGQGIDFTALSKSGTVAPSSYTPFGILHVDDHRRMFFMVPVKFEFTGAHLETPDEFEAAVERFLATLPAVETARRPAVTSGT
jgi:hypothetical protein